MKVLSFKNIRSSIFIVRTVIVLALSSLVAELVFHSPDGWQNDGSPWGMLAESFLVISVFAPMLWWFVLRPLQQYTEGKSRKTEQELLSLMEATLESTADGIVVLDTELQVVRYNQKYIQMWGNCAEQAFACRDARQIFEQIKGELLDPDLFLELSLRAYGNHDHSHTDEICFRDGRIYERYSQPQKVDGTTVGWVSSYRNITEKRRAEEALQKSEERFKQIVEQSKDALFLCTSDCIVVDTNRSAVALFGYEKEELINCPMQNIFKNSEFEQLCMTLLPHSLPAGCSVPKLSAHTKDGKQLFVSVRVKTIELTGEILLLFCMEDITDKVRLDEHTRDIQTKLIQTNKMTSLGLLVSGIAHEINNPNNYIMISSELLSRAWKDSLHILQDFKELHGDFMIGGVPFSSFQLEAQELVDGITDGSRRIRDIVNSLKDFSRDNSGLHENRVNLNQVVHMATTIIAHHIKRTTRHFNLDLAPQLPLVTGNKHQLEQVVINIVLNALQSLPSPDAGVKVSTSFEPATGKVLLVVEDQGIGITGDIHQLIMEPFFTTKLDSGGTGLGLSICQTIMRDHNGTINFTTESGKGTAFTLIFPAQS